jgi:hypothetical protein
MSKHAPGPWSVVQGYYPSFKDVIGPSFKISAVMWATDLTDDDYHKRIADLNLIAAAPDLLDALKTSKLFVEAMIEDQRCGDMFTAAALMLDKINYVINKAEGTL